MDELGLSVVGSLDLSKVLCALGDPVRMRIVGRLLQHGELSCKSICSVTPKSTLSHHLRILRESGITQTRLIGTQRLTKVREPELEEQFPGLLALVRSECNIAERSLNKAV